MENSDYIYIDLGYSPIPSGCRRLLNEVTIKKDGKIWRIHKNDPDPFPSKPHAHNVESGLKMDLSNGDLYFMGALQQRVNKKHLLDLRSMIAKYDIILPDLSV